MTKRGKQKTNRKYVTRDALIITKNTGLNLSSTNTQLHKHEIDRSELSTLTNIPELIFLFSALFSKSNRLELDIRGFCKASYL